MCVCAPVCIDDNVNADVCVSTPECMDDDVNAGVSVNTYVYGCVSATYTSSSFYCSSNTILSSLPNTCQLIFIMQFMFKTFKSHNLLLN